MISGRSISPSTTWIKQVTETPPSQPTKEPAVSSERSLPSLSTLRESLREQFRKYLEPEPTKKTEGGFWRAIMALMCYLVPTCVFSPWTAGRYIELRLGEDGRWITISSIVAYAVIPPVAGILADIYQRSIFVVVGLSLISVGSIFAGASTYIVGYEHFRMDAYAVAYLVLVLTSFRLLAVRQAFDLVESSDKRLIAAVDVLGQAVAAMIAEGLISLWIDLSMRYSHVLFVVGGLSVLTACISARLAFGPNQSVRGISRRKLGHRDRWKDYKAQWQKFRCAKPRGSSQSKRPASVKSCQSVLRLFLICSALVLTWGILENVTEHQYRLLGRTYDLPIPAFTIFLSAFFMFPVFLLLGSKCDFPGRSVLPAIFLVGLIHLGSSIYLQHKLDKIAIGRENCTFTTYKAEILPDPFGGVGDRINVSTECLLDLETSAEERQTDTVVVSWGKGSAVVICSIERNREIDRIQIFHVSIRIDDPPNQCSLTNETWSLARLYLSKGAMRDLKPRTGGMYLNITSTGTVLPLDVGNQPSIVWGIPVVLFSRLYFTATWLYGFYNILAISPIEISCTLLACSFTLYASVWILTKIAGELFWYHVQMNMMSVGVVEAAMWVLAPVILGIDALCSCRRKTNELNELIE